MTGFVICLMSLPSQTHSNTGINTGVYRYMYMYIYKDSVPVFCVVLYMCLLEVVGCVLICGYNNVDVWTQGGDWGVEITISS